MTGLVQTSSEATAVADPGFQKRGGGHNFFFFCFLTERVVPNTCRAHFNSIKMS